MEDLFGIKGVSQNPCDYTILIQGIPKIGKTELVAARDTFFLDCENGLQHIRTRKRLMENWNDISRTISRLCAESPSSLGFKYVCIDGLGMYVRYGMEFINRQYEIKHYTDLSWGKGAKLVQDVIIEPILKLSKTKFGLWIVSHTKEVNKIVGSKTITTHQSTIVSAVMALVYQLVDITVFATFDSVTDDLVLRTRSSPYYEAGGRIVLDDPIPLDRKSFDAAFKKGLLRLKRSEEGGEISAN
jgi:hypothetical protein